MATTRMLAAALATATAMACGGGDRDVDDANDMAADTGANVPAPDSTAAAGRATLRDAQGREAGTARLTRMEGGIAVELHATGLTPGDHGVHIHMVGACDAARAFESAGDHLNPGAREHGLRNPQGPHAGDLENLTVGTDGTGHLTYTVATLIPESVHDADGSALVIHADPDDQTTDPSGNSGGRVACGVFEREG